MTVKELKQKIDNGEAVKILDVRAPHEVAERKIEGNFVQYIPMSEIDDRINELKKDDDLIITCAKGGRSMLVCMKLKKAGYEKLTNLEGGVDAWVQL